MTAQQRGELNRGDKALARQATLGEVSRYRPIHLVAAVIAALLLVVSGGVTSAQALPSGTRCGFATMISVRGSNEAAGTGTTNGGRTYKTGGAGQTLTSLVAQANASPEVPVFQEALVYPAVILDLNNPTSKTYLGSLQTGIVNLTNEINDLVAKCPTTNILLAGYSQGADVISNVIGKGHAAGVTTQPLSAKAHARITAVMLFGDPRYRPNERWDAPGNGTKSGIFQSVSNQFNNSDKLTYLPPSYSTIGKMTTVRSYCFTGDRFCQSNPSGGAIHESYKNSSAIVSAWVFAKSWLVDPS